MVRGVTEAGRWGPTGRCGCAPTRTRSGTVRRLDVAGLDGEQRIAATYLPVVTIQEAEPPVDLRTVLPVRGGGLRNLATAGRLELLTGTAAGIATTPLAGTRCGAAGVADLDRAAADGSGVWFVARERRRRAARPLDRPRTRAAARVPAVLPGTVTALAAPGDGSLLFVARDSRGAALWRLPDAAAALGPPATRRWLPARALTHAADVACSAPGGAAGVAGRADPARCGEQHDDDGDGRRDPDGRGRAVQRDAGQRPHDGGGVPDDGGRHR